MLNIETNRIISQQLPKLIRRYDKMILYRNILLDSLNKIFTLNCRFSQNIQPELQTFDNNFHKWATTSQQKSQHMKILIQTINDLSVAVEQVSRSNLSEILKINLISPKMTEKIAKKQENFNKSMADYTLQMKGYNKKYSQYEANCNKLTDMMKRSDNCDGAIFYYNLHTDANNIKNIDKKFHQCQINETSLISNLEVIQQKRKILYENLKDIRDQYLAGLQNHLNTLAELARSLSDRKKDMIYSKKKRNSQFSSQNVFNINPQASLSQRRESLNDAQSQELIQIDQLTNAAQNIRNISELKLLAGRCQGIKNRICERSEQFLSIEKTFLTVLGNIIMSIQKNDKQLDTIQKQSFKTDMENFEYKFKKYFGSNMFEIMKLIRSITQNAAKNYSNIGRLLMQKERALKKIVDDKEFELKNFKKNSSSCTSLFYEKCQTKNQGSNDLFLISREFSNFREFVSSFLAEDNLLDRKYNTNLMSTIEVVNFQAQQNLLVNLLRKERESLAAAILQDYDVQGEIVTIVQGDHRYDILFHNEAFQPIHSSSFKSLLQKNKCSQTKSVLKKKANRKPTTITVMPRRGCCGSGADSKKMKDEDDKTSVRAILIVNPKMKIMGKITIDQKDISFVEKKTNLFTEKIELLIPLSEVKAYQRIKVQENEGIEILTNMGSIKFINEDVSILESALQKSFIYKISRKQSVLERSDSISRKEKSFSEHSSLIFKQNSSNLQYKISVDGPGNDAKLTAKSPKTNQPMTLKQLAESCKNYKCSSERMVPVKASLLNNNKILEYNYDDGLTKFLVREKRQCKVLEAANKLVIDIIWKVSFPEFSMLKSFAHSEVVTAQLVQKIAKISIIEKPRTQQHLYLRTKFYNQVEIMNKNLSDFIAKSCQRQGQVMMQQEIKDEIISNSELDFDETGQTKADSGIRVSR